MESMTIAIIVVVIIVVFIAIWWFFIRKETGKGGYPDDWEDVQIDSTYEDTEWGIDYYWYPSGEYYWCIINGGFWSATTIAGIWAIINHHTGH